MEVRALQHHTEAHVVMLQGSQYILVPMLHPVAQTRQTNLAPKLAWLHHQHLLPRILMTISVHLKEHQAADKGLCPNSNLEWQLVRC